MLSGAPSCERHGQFPEVPSFGPVGEPNPIRHSIVIAVVTAIIVIAIITVVVVAVAGTRDRRLAKGTSTRIVRERQPRLGLVLTYSLLRVITHARGERALQARPLCVGEAHLVDRKSVV